MLFTFVFISFLVSCGDDDTETNGLLSANAFKNAVAEQYQACETDSDCASHMRSCDDQCIFVAFNKSFFEEVKNLACDQTQGSCDLGSYADPSRACVNERCELSWD